MKIILIGDGQQREELERLAKKEGIQDIFMVLGLMPKRELVSWVQNALCSVIPLKGVKVLDTSSPNKLFDSFAAGIPVIQNTNGWIKDELEISNSGFTVPHDAPEELLKYLLYLKDNPTIVKEMGQNGLKLAKTKYDKKILAKKMLQGMKDLI